MAKVKPFGLGIVKGKRWLGLNVVLANLNKEIKKIEGGTLSGLVAGALKIKRDAISLAPIDTGNLRSSAYVIAGEKGKTSKVKRTGNEGKFKNKGGNNAAGKMASKDSSVLAERSGTRISDDPFAEIGFTAHYALAVHENLGVAHVRRKSKKKGGLVRTGQAKFLEHAVMKNRREVLKSVQNRARVK